jgi:WD40 repeat protein/Flp pilus assembly protein TadD
MQDSQHLTSVLYDGAADEVQVKVWDFQNHRVLFTKDMGEVNGPGGVRFTIDGRNLMVISIDGTFQTWDLRSITVLKTIRVSPNTFVPSSDGRLGILFPDDDDNSLDIYELEDQKQVSRLSFRSDLESMTGGSFTADGKRFISSHDNGKLMIWKIGSQEETKLTSAHPGHVLSIYVSPDGRRAITDSWEWEHVVWDLTTLSIMDRLRYKYEKGSTVISEDGGRAIDCSRNGLTLWDLEKGVQLQSLSSQPSTAAVLTNDDRIVVSADSDGLLHVTDIKSGRHFPTRGGHSAKVNRMLKTSNGRQVITASDDGTVKVWDPEQSGEVTSFTHGDSVTSAALSGNDRWLVTGSSESIKVWDLQSFNCIAALSTPFGHRLLDAVITSDGKRVIINTSPLPLAGKRGEPIKVWFVGQGDEVRALVGHIDDVSGIAQTPDGRFIVSASADNRLIVWDLNDSKPIATFTGEGRLTSCAVTSQGLIIAGEETGWVHFLRLENAVPTPPVSKYIPEKHQPSGESSSVIIRDDLEELTSPPPDRTSQNVDDLYTKGLQLFNSEDFEGALSNFERIITIQPRNSEAHLLHLSTLLRLERRQDAIDSADKVLENQLVSEEHLASLYMLKSSAQIGLRQFEQGLETLERSLDLDDGNAAGWEIRARTYSETGDYQQALESYLKMRELKWSEETEATIGLCYLHLDDIDQAETTFKSLIEEDSTLPLTYYGYGLCLILKNEPDKACKWLQRFLEDPGEELQEIIPQVQQIVDQIC